MFNVIVMVTYRWLIHAMQSRSAYYSVQLIVERVVLILKVKINRVKSVFASFLDHLHFQSFIRAYVNDEPRECAHEKVPSQVPPIVSIVRFFVEVWMCKWQ